VHERRNSELTISAEKRIQSDICSDSLAITSELRANPNYESPAFSDSISIADSLSAAQRDPSVALNIETRTIQMARKRVKTALKSANSSKNDTQKQPYPPLPLKEIARLAAEIIETIAGVVPGKPSDIKDKELVECVTASRIALCWHLASIKNSARRYDRLRGLRRNAARCAVAMHDLGLAVFRPSGFGHRLERLNRIIYVDGLNEDSQATSQNDRTDMAVRCDQVEGPISMVMPDYTSIHCGELVDKLFQSLANRGASPSEEETELRASACYAAMCWFTASLEDGHDAEFAILEFQAFPKLVFTTIVVSLAEQQGIPVFEAAARVGDSDWIDYETYGAKWCFWVGKDGTTKYSGPIERTQYMVEYCQTRDHLRKVEHAIGGEFDAVDPEAIENFLADPFFRTLQTLTCREQDSCFYWICFRK
jgi:hypothetical protein